MDSGNDKKYAVYINDRQVASILRYAFQIINTCVKMPNLGRDRTGMVRITPPLSKSDAITKKLEIEPFTLRFAPRPAITVEPVELKGEKNERRKKRQKRKGASTQ